MTFKPGEGSSGLTLSLSLAPLCVPARSLSRQPERPYLPRLLHDIKAVDDSLLTLHVCCTLSIVAFFFSHVRFYVPQLDIKMPVTQQESSLTSIVPSHFNRLIQGIMYFQAWQGEGRTVLKETV